MYEFPEVADLLLDTEALVRAVGSGAQRGSEVAWRRVEVRYVDLAAGRRLHVELFDERQSFAKNYEDVPAAIDDVLAIGFANWHVESRGDRGEPQARHEITAVRINRKGKVLVNRSRRDATAVDHSHDRAKERMLPEDAPLLRELGLADADGRIKPSRQAKFRQVDEFLRALAATVDEAMASGNLKTPSPEHPWRVVDLGCGNAYLTFAAQAWLESRGLAALVVGVDVKEQSKTHNSEVASRLGVADSMSFVVGAIDDVVLDEVPDIVLALHVCDTATDEALARAVGWDASVVLAAPCCHHDIAGQLRKVGAPAPYDAMVRDGILRERLADTMTDALRASLLRSEGYRVAVVEFIESKHTPRNSLIRAVKTGRSGTRDEYNALVGEWNLKPRLGALLDSWERSRHLVT